MRPGKLKKPRRAVAALTLCVCLALGVAAPAFAVGEKAADAVDGVEVVGKAAETAGGAALPKERVVSGGARANAPSDGGWEGVGDGELLAFLEALAALPHYQQERAARYLNYYGGKTYTNEQILRIVNTDNDLTPFFDGRYADFDTGALMLANKYHYLGLYEPEELVPLGPYGSWGELQSEAYEAFAALVGGAEEAGFRIWSNSPYRSYARQRGIYGSYAARYGYRVADTYSARPGYSEHQTGLAVDISVRGDAYSRFGGTPAFEWVSAHAHEYGWILRYGEGMSYITGYRYEPWHYRYVGVEAATYIYEHELTFEEYYYYYVVGGEIPK